MERYTQLLKEELVLAMGCTEPIAIAYAASLAKKYLQEEVISMEIAVSGNIIKNVKSVIVPNTGGLRGIGAAAIAGIVGGKSELELEVLSQVTLEQKIEMKEKLDQIDIQIKEAKTNHLLDIMITLYGEHHHSFVRITNRHSHIQEIKVDDEMIYYDEAQVQIEKDRSFMSIEGILEYVEQVSLEDVKELLDRQIKCNMAIAKEGLSGRYGAAIGLTLLSAYGDSVQNRARAYAAAGSDARMNGCELPVVINSGSGNQGLSASLPVIVYAQDMNVTDEQLYRALLVSNLTTIHLKTGIGCLSAYCGAISAACGGAAGVMYLHGGRFNEIAHTIVNALAINSGVVCDGAKASCAAKIASAVESALLGMQMYLHHRQFYGGDGLVSKGVENTIKNISRLASQGMAMTDKEIIDIMMEN